MTDAVAADRLKAIVKQIESVEEDLSALKTDLKEIYAGAKSEGFDVRILKRVITRRRKGPQAVREEDELLELYETAVGSQMKLPLGEAA